MHAHTTRVYKRAVYAADGPSVTEAVSRIYAPKTS